MRASHLLLAVVLAAVLASSCGRVGFDESRPSDDAGTACSGEGSVCGDGVRTGVCLESRCCLGCIEGGVCLSGDIADACGTAGAACQVCAADSFCERNQCTSGRRTERIALGARHSCAIVSGALHCWGDNAEAQLGLGHLEGQLSPTRVGLESDWFAVTAGEEHTCGLRGSGLLFCWGANVDGSVLTGDFEPRQTLPTLVGDATDWVQVEAGHDYTCARNSGGELWCGGRNTEAQLGQGTRTPNDPGGLPDLVQVANTADWRDIGSGRGHNCGLRGGGELICWGANDEDQQGHPAGGDDPSTVPGFTDWTEVNGNAESTCALRAGGGLYCWGSNTFGLHGLGDATGRGTPTLVSTDVRAWSSYIFHACGITEAGRLRCAGRAIEGQLGIDDSSDQLDLIEPTVGMGEWVEIATGRFHTCARRRDGSIWCTGENDVGALGLGDVNRRDNFEPVSFGD